VGRAPDLDAGPDPGAVSFARTMTLRRLSPRALALDAAALLGLLALPILAWNREGVTRSAGQAWWEVDTDPYLFGPDAGAWAQNALALHQGRLADLDPHRLPTWTLFTSWTMDLTGWDVVYAGHLVNRAEHVLLGPVLYLLGRSLGLGALSVAAAALVVIQPALLAAACRFGIDPTVTFLVPLMLLTARWGGRVWWLAPLSGAVAGLTMVSHLTAVAFPLCGLLLCLVSGRGVWRRLLAGILYGLAAWLTFKWVFSVFPMLPSVFFENAIAEGISPTAGAAPSSQATSREAALEILKANGGKALDGALVFIAEHFRPTALPWALGVALVWLGLLGPGAVRALPAGGGWRARAGAVARSGLEGLAVASALAPLLAFAASKAPERYSENLLPVAAFVTVRGGATVLAFAAALAGLRLAPRWRRLLEPALFAAAALIWGVGAWREPHAAAPVKASPEERRALPIGRALAEHFPPGGAGASALREVLPYANLRYCPSTVCPFSDTEASYAQCVTILQKECAGEGDIPLVVVDGLTTEQRSERRAHFEEWVGTRLAPVATVGNAKIYALPREGGL
jgi:hypothetical protein